MTVGQRITIRIEAKKLSKLCNMSFEESMNAIIKVVNKADWYFFIRENKSIMQEDYLRQTT